MGLPYGENFISQRQPFSMIHPSDRQTDGQTERR